MINCPSFIFRDTEYWWFTITFDSFWFFRVILKRNNDYSDTLDIRREWEGEVTFFVLKVPDFKSAVLIYLYVFICVRMRHDIGRSFEPIFVQFTWLVRVHTWVNTVVFRNNRPWRTTDMGGKSDPKQVFQLLFSQYGFFWGGKNPKPYSVPHFGKVILIFVDQHPLSWKMVIHQKLFFMAILEKI